MTTVISVRGKDRAMLLADPSFVYAGRRCAGWPASVWGNPFKRGMTPREATRILDQCPGGCPQVFTEAARDEEMTGDDLIDCYRAWLPHQPQLLAGLIGLRGKVLGCWCGSWRPGEPEILCHAVVLAKLAAAPEGPQ